VFAASSSPDRGKLVNEYIITLPEKGDPQRGAKLFAKTCAACHKLGEVGQQIGPDLASVADKSINGLLVAILDPNRAVEARYVNYLAITKDGRTLNGMIASETSTSVMLVGVDGKSHALLRNQIDELTSTGKSMMPEGLEKDLPPQEMADLIAFLRANLPAQKSSDRRPVPQRLERLLARALLLDGFHQQQEGAALVGEGVAEMALLGGELGRADSRLVRAVVEIPAFGVDIYFQQPRGAGELLQ